MADAPGACGAQPTQAFVLVVWLHFQSVADRDEVRVLMQCRDREPLAGGQQWAGAGTSGCGRLGRSPPLTPSPHARSSSLSGGR